MIVDVQIKHIEAAYHQLKAAQKTLVQLEHLINLSYQGNGIETMKWCVGGACTQTQVQSDLDKYLSAIKVLTQGFIPSNGCQVAGGGGTVGTNG